MSKLNAKRAALGLERLAERDVPAILVGMPAPHVVTFTGDGAADYLAVFDNGSAWGNNVSYRTSPNAAPTVIASAVPITRININTGGGTDHVEHTITGALVGAPFRDVLANLGDADDEFVSTVNGPIMGNSTMGLALNINGGNGGDEITGRLNGDILGTAQVRFGFAGGGDPGCDFMNVFLDNDIDIAPGASFDANVYGGAGNDNIELRYDGQLDGSLNYDLDGESDSDWVRAYVTIDQNSRGELGTYSDPASVRGGLGDDDTVEHFVTDNSIANPWVWAEISAGTGTGSGVGAHDRLFLSPNVHVV